MGSKLNSVDYKIRYTQTETKLFNSLIGSQYAIIVSWSVVTCRCYLGFIDDRQKSEGKMRWKIIIQLHTIVGDSHLNVSYVPALLISEKGVET